MDLANQDKLKNWLIVILAALNVITVTFIWLQRTKTSDLSGNERPAAGSGSIGLMKKALNLSDDQTDRLTAMITDFYKQTKVHNNQLTNLKKKLAENIFEPSVDTNKAELLAKEIGEVQSKVEVIRFKHFQELLGICTPAQREKLKPILIELVSRKPPRGDSAENSQPRLSRNNPPQEEKRLKKADNNGTPASDENIQKEKRPNSDQPPQDQRDGRPAPPSADEKLAKFSERLNLTDDQSKKIRTVMEQAIQKGEQLRSQKNPDQNTVEQQKESIRKLEDEGIMKILNEDQKKEFEKMMLNRRK